MILLDGVLEVLVEALESVVVLEALHGDDDLISSDDEPHMLHGEDNGVISHQNLASLAGQQVGVQQPHVPDGNSQLVVLHQKHFRDSEAIQLLLQALHSCYGLHAKGLAGSSRSDAQRQHGKRALD